MVLGRNVDVVALQHTHGDDYVTATHNKHGYFDSLLALSALYAKDNTIKGSDYISQMLILFILMLSQTQMIIINS